MNSFHYPGENNENLSAGSAGKFGTDFAGNRSNQRVESRKNEASRDHQPSLAARRECSEPGPCAWATCRCATRPR